MIGRNFRTLALLTIIVVMLACTPTFSSVVPPTLDPLAINTVIAQTAAAAATQTAAFAPATFTASPTSLPTRTPTEIPTSTPTFIFILPTSTQVFTPTQLSQSSNLAYECRVVSQDPDNNSVFAVQARFDMTWRIGNIGTSNWNGNNTDIFFASGDQIHRQPVYDMPRSVPVGGQVDIVVSMQAPNAPGTYSTTWKLRTGKTELCPMTLTIVVQ